MNNNPISPNEKQEDPLEAIFVDENVPADRKIIAEILGQFVTIDKKGSISFTKSYDDLQHSKKVLVYMLCKKAMILRNLPDIKEYVTLNEVVEKALVSESNAKNALFTYYKDIVKKDGLGYIIPNYKLTKAKEAISGKKDG